MEVMMQLSRSPDKYCIVVRYLYSAAQGTNQTERYLWVSPPGICQALDERQREREEERGAERRREAIPERRFNRYKGPSLSQSFPDMRKEKIVAMGRLESGCRE